MNRSGQSVRCPTCGRPTSWKDNPHRPFCSERCRLVDLEGWLTGRYIVPGDPEESAIPPSELDPADEPPGPQPREKT
jgi:uncharacterized protein